MEHITDDVLSVFIGFPPGHLYGGGGEGLCFHVGGNARQSISPEHREAGTGLRRARAVLSDALVDSLVILTDAIYCQCAVEAAEERSRKQRVWERRKETRKFSFSGANVEHKILTIALLAVQ